MTTPVPSEELAPQDLAQLGFERLQGERERLDHIDNYIRGIHAGPYVPRNASPEYKLLAQRCITNFLPLIVKTPSQSLAVEGYRRDPKDVPADGSVDPEWTVWQTERMDARQTSVMRTALTYGLSYVTVLPDVIDPSRTRIKGISPRFMYASYADPASDDLPLWAIHMETVPDQENVEARGWLIDATNVYEVLVNRKDGPVVESQRVHGAKINGQPVCPVVRFSPDIDLEGRVTGVVEPMIPMQDRVNQTVFDLLVAQTFGSFKVRTVSGMAPDFETDADGNIVMDTRTNKPKVKPLRVPGSGAFLVAPDPDTKFGQLDETPLAGYIDAIEMGIKHMSAVSQTPPHYLLGSMVNIAAEALTAAEGAKTRFDDELKHVFGESWELVNGLSGTYLGRELSPTAQVRWKDAESRSLSQTVDALGKAVQMMGVPARALWSRIPGVSATDIEEWQQIAETDDPALRMADAMSSAVAPAVTDV